MMASVGTSVVPAAEDRVLRRAVAVVLGALVVAAAAQVAVPVPGTVVPLTLQVPAVLVVGGLLGPRLGAASLVLYLAMGAMGLPAFAPQGVPGVARLFGPTGGYLLAFPLAAALVGAQARAGSPVRLAVGLLLGLAAIHAAGTAQLAALGGDLAVAARIGSVPFLAADAVKLLVAGLVIGKLGSTTRALV